MLATSSMKSDEYLGQNLLAISNLIETKIAHELNLINHRVSWLATSQTFLVLAMATMLNGLPSTPHYAIMVLVIGLPIVGLAVCFQVWLAVRAAFEVLQKNLLPHRAELVRELNRLSGTQFAELGTDRLTDFKGSLPAKYIPLTFLIWWCGMISIAVWRLFY